jgi:hypothetical protein
MLLNQTTQLFAAGRVTAVDFEKGVAVWQEPNGNIRVVPFDVATLRLRQN